MIRKNEPKEFELAQLMLQDELYCHDCVIEIRYGNWIPFPNWCNINALKLIWFSQNCFILQLIVPNVHWT